MSRSEMTRRVVQDERGIALVMALMIVTVLSVSTAALLIVVAVNHRESLRSAEARKAFGLAEVGLAYAEGRVYGAAASQTDPLTDIPTVDQDGGTVTYWATVAGDGHTWTMHGRGEYQGVTRNVTAQADVPSPITRTDGGVWNYLYADKVTTDGSCPTTIGGSTTVSVPTFVRGNLCLQSGFTGSQLGVGGNLILQNSGNQHGGIGSSSSPIQTLAVGGTCNGVATGTGICNGHTSPIYASTVSTSLGITPGLPPLNLSTSYSTANPGPAAGQGCPTGSNVPSPFFDNDTTLNDSVPSVNLFPTTTAYDCINGANEIKWCPVVNLTVNCPIANNTFTVNGTFYFDGNLSLSGNAHIVYSGQGSLYFTGTISTSGSFSLCGITNCTSAWNTDPTTTPPGNAIVLVAACWADSSGTLVRHTTTTSPYCVSYAGTTVMQVATYCATDYYIQGTASNWGPVLADTLTLNGNLSELVPFHVMPPGTPLNTSTVYLPASAPTYWSG